MRILVDADACPVKEIIVKMARASDIEVIMVIDDSHVLNDGYSTVITVDTARDSADIRLANELCKSDIVVTQDYGVASLALGKKAWAVNQNGLIYTDQNIDMLMMQRYESGKQRRRGRYGAGPQKRTKQNDADFAAALEKLLQCAKAASLQ
ncbi:MAG: YaiI/YqxD family protein [Oscillospiraceae bacterium]|nr:YaiI/YqxD family protein [Oscillospiraceae bacterium]